MALISWLIVELAFGFGFRPLGRVTFSLLVQRESNQRESTPGIRVSLRSTSLIPSLFQGHVAKGHPWPIAPLAASMPLNPFRNDSARPPEVDSVVPGTSGLRWEAIGDSDSDPFRRPSGGVAQGDERPGRARKA